MEAKRRAGERPQVQRPHGTDPERRRAGRDRQVGDARQEAEPQLAAGGEATRDRRDALAAQHEVAERLDQLRIGAARLIGAGVAIARARDGAKQLERLVRREAERERAVEAGVGVSREQKARRAEELPVQPDAKVPHRPRLRGGHAVEADRTGQHRQERVRDRPWQPPPDPAGFTGAAVVSRLAAGGEVSWAAAARAPNAWGCGSRGRRPARGGGGAGLGRRWRGRRRGRRGRRRGRPGEGRGRRLVIGRGLTDGL